MPKTKRRRKITKIVLTGGHAATTALAVVQELTGRGGRDRDGAWEIYWVGPKSAIEGRKIAPLEESVFPRMGVTLRQIPAGRLQRRFTLWTIPSLLKIPLGLIFAFWELTRIKPKVILSFGGFAAFPVVVAGFILGIPVVLHEQTVAAGRANKYAAFFARRITLAREESLKFFPKEKCVVVGNPVMAQILALVPKSKPVLPITVFVTGGSRGSLTINEAVSEILPRLLSQFSLIHHTGSVDYEKFVNLKKALPQELSDKYEVYGQVDPMKMNEIYRRADLIIARAGANTVSEIMVTKIPSILIPIPWSYEDEQTGNAKLAQDFGIAKPVRQDSLTPNVLLKEILFMAKNWDYFVSKTRRKVSPDTHAAEKLSEVVKEFV